MTTESNSLTQLEQVLPDISMKEVTKIIATSSAKASAIAVLPVPIIDIAGVTYVQLRMVNKLAERFGVNSDDKTMLIIGSLASNLIASLVTSATEGLAATAKVDKILGQSLIKATISGFVTTLVGEVYADHFKRGGTFEDLSVDRVIDYFKRQLSSDRVSVDNIAQAAMSAVNDKLNLT